MLDYFQRATKDLPQSPGVYLFRNATGKPLYIGKAINLRHRVGSYFQKSAQLGPKTELMVGQIAKIEHFQTSSEFDAFLLEADLIKRLKPKYNRQLKDDKAYPMIKITKENFPQVLITRQKHTKNIEDYSEQRHAELVSASNNPHQIPNRVRNDRREDLKASYFGPYPQGDVRQVLKLLRRAFPYRNCSKSKFKRYQKLGRGCLFFDIKLCPAPCTGNISEKSYKKQIDRLQDFLRGKGKIVIKDLKLKMTNHVKKQKFEEAAQLRNQIAKLRYIQRGFRSTDIQQFNINLPEDRQRQKLEELQKVLGLAKLPQRIEAYDISNISGQHATGSMVVFENAKPKKAHYRKFKIKTLSEPDDVGMIKEVLKRRFLRIEERISTDRHSELVSESDGKKYIHQIPKQVRDDNKKDESFSKTPDLILIDGGKSQLNAALKVLKELNLKIPTVALAKREEEIYTRQQGKKSAEDEEKSQTLHKVKSLTLGNRPTLRKLPTAIKLPKASPALQLLQYLRDESHRFALAYHRTLRSRATIQTLPPV